MALTIAFQCDGCFKEETSRRLERRFIGTGGKSWGFGHWETDTIETVAPDGWQAFDPYTGACYCAECWAGIMKPEAAE